MRESGSENERHALKSRAQQAERDARDRSCEQEFNNLSHLLKERSGVVVSMPATVARQLVANPQSLYANYEMLVGSRGRRPAAIEDDRHRKGVVGILFGTYGEKLVYGILSFNDTGLPTYGEVSCRLREVAVAERTSFLECNSYQFVEAHDLKPGAPAPVGYRAVWDNRDLLGVAKLARFLRRRQRMSEWQQLLVKSDGASRAEEDFIEAHIYDTFDIEAVESMSQVSGKALSKEQRLDAKIALNLFQKRQ